MSNRTVATDALATLGTIIDDTQKRDAIHLAVEPVIAGERLKPGECITVIEGIARAAGREAALGIVDPFLERPVKQGERFWFIMMPRMVTSLRHVWAHPAFPDEVGTPAPEKSNKDASEAWLREYHSRSSFSLVSFKDMIFIAQGGTAGDISHEGDYIYVRGSDAHESIPSEFWDHMETFTGKQFSKFDRAEYFSCSC